MKSITGYGDVAVKAVAMIREGVERSPVIAWDAAVAEVFPNSMSAQEKSCPRSAFLGLCESGRVAGVSAGEYTRSKKNKEYALLAIDLLVQDPGLVDDVRLLWITLLGGGTKVPNDQMTVVAALWRESLILA